LEAVCAELILFYFAGKYWEFVRFSKGPGPGVSGPGHSSFLNSWGTKWQLKYKITIFGLCCFYFGGHTTFGSKMDESLHK
jgi:hypothetical protein